MLSNRNFFVGAAFAALLLAGHPSAAGADNVPARLPSVSPSSMEFDCIT